MSCLTYEQPQAPQVPQSPSYHSWTPSETFEKNDARHPLIDSQDLSLGSELLDGDGLHGQDVCGDIVVLVASDEIESLAVGLSATECKNHEDSQLTA